MFYLVPSSPPRQHCFLSPISTTCIDFTCRELSCNIFFSVLTFIKTVTHFVQNLRSSSIIPLGFKGALMRVRVSVASVQHAQADTPTEVSGGASQTAMHFRVLQTP